MPKAKASAKKKLDREVRFPDPVSDVCYGDSAVTIDDAKELLGWEEETAAAKFGTDFMLVDENGKKVRCTNNIGNRPFSLGLARQWQSEVLEGHWMLNLEPIIIGKTGIVISGQHRLVGLILACQAWHKDPDRYPFWSTEPTLQTVVSSGCDESDEVVNTIDTGRPRTLADVIYRSPYFADLKNTDRNHCAKHAQAACKLFKLRVGADLNSFRPHWSHADYLDLLNQHSKLLECVRHVHEENGDENKIGRYLSPGYAAGLMYLMGASASDGSRKGDYRSAATPDEKLLDWTNWDKAQTFIVLLAGDSKELQGYRDAWADMVADNRDSNAERWALLCTAWNLFIEGEKITLEDLALEYDTNEDGVQSLQYTPTVGGIDIGNPKEVDEEEMPLDATGRVPDPNPEEIQARKEKILEEKGKTRQIPILKPARAGKEWAAGDVAWIKDPDGEHYLAELTSDPWPVEDAKGMKTDRLLVDVRDAKGGEWEIELMDLFLLQPNTKAKAPSVLPMKPDKKTGKPDGWKVGDVAWVHEKGGEDWRGKIQETSSNSVKLKVLDGFQGAGNTKMVWLKNLSRKQSIVA